MIYLNRINFSHLFLILSLILLTLFVSTNNVAKANELDNCIDLNTATYDELREIIHIDEHRADLIIDFREDHEFKSVKELTLIKGIGDIRIEDIKSQNIVCSEDLEEADDTNDSSDNGENNNNEEGDENEEHLVPETSTNTYNIILIGSGLLLISILSFFLFRRKTA